MKFKTPKYSENQALQKSQTYSTSLYIPTQLIFQGRAARLINLKKILYSKED